MAIPTSRANPVSPPKLDFCLWLMNKDRVGELSAFPEMTGHWLLPSAEAATKPVTEMTLHRTPIVQHSAQPAFVDPPARQNHLLLCCRGCGLRCAQVSDNLMDVVRNGFVRPNYFRMAVFDGEKATALLSQNDVVEFIAQSPDLLGVKATCPISKLGMASAKAASVKETDTVLNALALARAQGQREVGVLDAAGKLVGIINAGTLEGVADLSTLLLSISEFKAKHPIAEPVIVSSRATLSEVVAVVGPAARRVYVVDEQGMPEFFMPTEDVLRNIVNSGWEFNNVTVADVCKIAHHPIQVLTMNTEKTLGEAMKVCRTAPPASGAGIGPGRAWARPILVPFARVATRKSG